MTTLTMQELEAAAVRELGASAWHTIEQRHIDLFAEATGDAQWIHVDRAAAAEGPFGGTIAHGYLTLSMLPMLVSEVLNVDGMRMLINYGIDRIRFTAPVRSGSAVRLHATLVSTERRGEGALARLGVRVEIEAEEKPALVGEVLYLAVP